MDNGQTKNKILRIVVLAVIAVVIFATAFCAGFFTRKCTQGRELTSYEWALDIINKNYYFGDVEKGATDAALGGLALNYLDKYSQFYTAEEYAATLASNAGSKSGIGVSYTYVSGKGVLVNSVTGNSPAYKCGLRAGEYLVEGGAGESSVKFTSSADFQNLISEADESTDITLTSSDGGKYSLRKAEYTASYTLMYTNSSLWYFSDAAEGGLALYEEKSDDMDYLPDGAAYISLSQFYGTAAKEFAVLVEKFNANSLSTLISTCAPTAAGTSKLCRILRARSRSGRRK